MNPELINYVGSARRSGLSDGEIRQNLLNQGWPQADVEAVLTGATAATATPPVPSANAAANNQTLMAVLAYLGILIIIPFMIAKENQFVKFHLKQGLAIIVVWLGYWVVTWTLAILNMSFFNFLIYPIIGLGLLILEIIGIINAVQGQQKELPIVGKLATKLNI